MTWHLKDKQLEEKLIGLCSVFLEKLNYGVYLKREDENYILVSFDREKSGNCLEGNELWFWIDELEEIHEYNPNGWNEYPKVTPPEGVLMRLELEGKMYFGGLYHKFYDGEGWCYADGKPMPIAYSEAVRRFRPWDD